ncbi:hypothetical protein QJR26_08930 [Clostridium baratii]
MKSNIEIINKNVKKSVEKAIDNKMIPIADMIVEKLRSNNLLRDELSYYRKVELLLINLNALKEAVKQKDEEIEDLEKYGLPGKSKSVVVYSSAGGNPESDRYLEKKEKYLIEREETKRNIDRIEKALSKIKDDKYFKIIELRYLNDDKVYSDESIAEILNKDRSTISRNRKRLINLLVTILFPQTIQELI